MTQPGERSPEAAVRAAWEASFPSAQAQPRVFFAPGRVNLIGAHIDYNGGSVLPVSIGLGTFVAIAPAAHPGAQLRVHALDLGERVGFDMDQLVSGRASWAGYVTGVFEVARRRGLRVEACDVVVSGTLPRGGGLSSSASLEVAVAFALCQLFDWTLDLPALAELAREVETGFVGVSCGILDQYAVALGRERHALALDCSAKRWRYAPFPEDLELVVLDTRIPRSLVTSAYNDRVRECSEALALLEERSGPGRVGWGEYAMDDVRHLADQPLLAARARHVIGEFERVQESTRALERGQAAALGAAMSASHRSCSVDYEVSCDELDCLVEAASELPGVLGARMMGAGFGGCAVALARAERFDQAAEEHVRAEYLARCDREAGILRVRAGGGPREFAGDSGRAPA